MWLFQHQHQEHLRQINNPRFPFDQLMLLNITFSTLNWNMEFFRWVKEWETFARFLIMCHEKLFTQKDELYDFTSEYFYLNSVIYFPSFSLIHLLPSLACELWNQVSFTPLHTTPTCWIELYTTSFHHVPRAMSHVIWKKRIHIITWVEVSTIIIKKILSLCLAELSFKFLKLSETRETCL